MTGIDFIPAGLWILLVVFLLRVAGQALVLVARPRFLPPMKDWYSGLIPYRVLLPIQLAILALMTSMAVDVTRNSGFFSVKREVVGLIVLSFSLLYALSMVIRLTIRMRRHPELRWYEGGTIPTLFHFVLAGFLFLFARWNLS